MTTIIIIVLVLVAITAPIRAWKAAKSVVAASADGIYVAATGAAAGMSIASSYASAALSRAEQNLPQNLQNSAFKAELERVQSLDRDWEEVQKTYSEYVAHCAAKGYSTPSLQMPSRKDWGL